MRLKLLSILTIMAVFVGLFGFTTQAQAGAYGASFTSSITYQNIGTASATIHVDFYANASSTAIPFDLPALPALAGSSLFVGSVGSISSGFSGSAVMSSDQPLAVTIVQVPGSTTGIKSRPLTNGLASGATSIQIPTVLKNTFGFNTVFSVQNAGSAAADVTVNFIPLGGGATVTKTVTALPAGSGQSFDLGTMSDWTTFNGSVRMTSTAPLVATDLEYQIAGNKAYGFEGTSGGSATIYMPSAFCKWGSTKIDSSYAIQNANTSGDVSVTIQYKDTSVPPVIYNEPAVTITPGNKDSFPGCGKSGTLVPNGFIGSATITATGGNIVAIAKIFDTTLGTAFLGFADAPSKVAVPYVRYANATDWFSGARQRTFIAIQNIGAADLAAGAVTVKFYDKNGAQVGTTYNVPAMPIGSKQSASAVNAGLSEFGFYPDNTAGGSAVVEGPAGSKLAVVARVQTYIGGPTAGEDYNGIAMP